MTTEVKISPSSSYQDYLISSLQNEEHAKAYLAAFLALDEEGREPEVLRAGLKDIIDARILGNNLSEIAKESYQELDKLLSENAGNEIYTLIEFLDALGYRIALVPKEEIPQQ
ncbi:MAG: transcriptional regulator [Dolichospermum sp. DET50]|jgi:DNA-binding phage protein|nr:transcriptional regulator [Dolichospermum sp. DET66]MBS3033976.1 transcriptional regulator [Dolichospermum sp. DET67]MBS3039179.1 transcriptional regulator [Dolichospermum sp. DET50]QSX66418.1 MAG: transcriptional regulator [Dolichospermum sp. DET69]